ncbi:MAG: hypothetical protein VKS61_14270, partial [Candidatus Sericytochromatia bacterium]|nr:hypothetical protein [Candidatus Sericytochromatia bacterium]
QPWLVGILVPDGSPLPPLPPGFHAVSQADPEALDLHMQDLLDAPVGVLGLKVSALPTTHGTNWFLGVMELVRWTARLLPLEGQTTLEVFIEQRGDYTPETNVQPGADELMRQLAETDPKRARKLRIHQRIVRKDASPHLGYADLVSFAWAQSKPFTASMMRQSGLLGACLQHGNASELRRAWEAIDGGRLPDAATWQRFLVSPDASVPGSLVRMLLERVAEACRSDADYWKSLCEGVLAHLDGREVNLVALGRAVDALLQCQPVGTALTPRMLLAFHTARLWRANHLGAIDLADAQTLEQLGERLFEEVPTLVCQADLVRAVTHTNLFDFDGAAAAIARWQDQRPEVAGLQHHGRLLSTLGQHAAFRGDADGARALFEQALACFARISEPDLVVKDKEQTGTYRAIAAIDSLTLTRDAVQAALADVAGPLTPEALAAWPGDDARPYLHHTVVRWLVAHGTPEERAAYRQAGGTWVTEAFHPWELTEAYRGLLCWDAGDLEMATAFVDSGIMLALDPGQGPTVQFIGLCLARLGTGLGLEVEQPDDATVQALRDRLPRAPWAAWEEATSFPTLPEATAWLARVLPFNFR